MSHSASDQPGAAPKQLKDGGESIGTEMGGTNTSNNPSEQPSAGGSANLAPSNDGSRASFSGHFWVLPGTDFENYTNADNSAFTIGDRSGTISKYERGGPCEGKWKDPAGASGTFCLRSSGAVSGTYQAPNGGPMQEWRGDVNNRSGIVFRTARADGRLGPSQTVAESLGLSK